MLPETHRDLPIRIDGPRLIYTGGEVGLIELGLGRPLDVPLVREDVTPEMLPTIRKPSVSHGFDRMETVWPVGASAPPCLGEFELEALRQQARVLRAAQSAVMAHNDLLNIFASVAAVSRRDAPSDDLLASKLDFLWHEATSVRTPRTEDSLMNSDRARNSPGVRNAFQKLTVSLRKAHPDFVDVARAAVHSVLERRDAILGRGPGGSTVAGEGRDALGAELVAGRFVDQAAAYLKDPASGPLKRLAFRDLWTWPWDETNPDRALLGLIAMRVLENTSGDPERWFTAGWGSRPPFEFLHATAGSPLADGGLLIVKPRWAAPSAKLTGVLESLRVLWTRYTGSSADATAAMLRDYTSKALRKKTGGVQVSEAERLLTVLRGAEKDLKFSPDRYVGAYRSQQDLASFIPLIVAVAVEYEQGHSRL